VYIYTSVCVEFSVALRRAVCS